MVEGVTFGLVVSFHGGWRCRRVRLNGASLNWCRRWVALHIDIGGGVAFVSASQLLGDVGAGVCSSSRANESCIVSTMKS